MTRSRVALISSRTTVSQLRPAAVTVVDITRQHGAMSGTAHVAFPERPPLAPAVNDYVMAVDLPIEQKIVALQARGGSLAKELLEHIRVWGAPDPQASDYVAMIKRRAITKRGDDYAVTPGGLHDATTIMRALCKAIGIHRPEPVTSGGRFDDSQRCTCGWSAGLSLNQGHVGSQGAHAFAKHLDHVAKTGGRTGGAA